MNRAKTCARTSGATADDVLAYINLLHDDYAETVPNVTKLDQEFLTKSDAILFFLTHGRRK